MWTIKKLARTLAGLTRLGLARMLGEYDHSGWNGEFHYVQYRWRGKTWIFPTGPLEEPEHTARR